MNIKIANYANNTSWHREYWKEHRLLFFVVISYSAVSLTLFPLDNHEYTDFIYYFSGLFELSLISAVILLCTLIVYRVCINIHAGFSYLPILMRELYNNYIKPERFFGGLTTMLLVPLFITSYTNLKISIPLFTNFLFDVDLYKIEKILHGGFYPWEFFLPLINHEVFTVMIDRFYFYGWSIIWIGTCSWMSWSRNRHLRSRFFMGFLTTWCLLGTILAYLLSSAGPCYLSRLNLPASPYQELFLKLDTIDSSASLTSKSGQDYLWSVYESGEFKAGCGISAMPSIHIALATLCTLCVFSISRVLGILFCILTFILLIGSVILGWHYAIDGYVSIILTVIIWITTKRFADRTLLEDKPS